jgi:hypothetical protein
MNANELRLGNYIQDTNYPERVCRVFRLTQGNDFNITYHYDRVCECSYANERKESLQPIPLTEEWLMKFGFKLTISNKDSGYKQYGINKNGFDIMFSIDCNCCPECFIENIGIEITYVHQLQNVFFALCGEELTIK